MPITFLDIEGNLLNMILAMAWDHPSPQVVHCCGTVSGRLIFILYTLDSGNSVGSIVYRVYFLVEGITRLKK